MQIQISVLLALFLATAPSSPDGLSPEEAGDDIETDGYRIKVPRGERSAFIGMTGFGASAPAEKLFEHFGITPAAIVAAARKLVEQG